MSDTVRKNLGIVTAYAYARSKGYEGTEEEFAELMASYADVAEEAAQSASEAAQSAVDAAVSESGANSAALSAQASVQAAASEVVAAQAAKTGAEQAAGAASNSANTAAGRAIAASGFADAAEQSATNASGSATAAQNYSGTAATAAQTASGYADNAGNSATAAAGSATAAAASAAEAAESARTLTIDTTLTQQGQAAEAKKTGDEISAIKADLSDVNERIGDVKSAFEYNRESNFNAFVYADTIPMILSWEYGNINFSGQNDNNDRKYYARTVSAITTKQAIKIKFTLKASITDITNLVLVEYNASTHTMINRTAYQTGTYQQVEITTVVGTEYRFCIMGASSIVIDLNNMDDYAMFTTNNTVATLKSTTDKLTSDVEDIKTAINPGQMVVPIDYTATIGYMSKTGTAVANGAYGYTNKISVVPGDVLVFVPKKNGKDPTIRFVTAFNGETAISANGAENVGSYTVPNGIDGVVVTGYVADSGVASSIPYLFKFTSGVVNRSHDSNGFVVRQSSLADGEQINIPLNNVSKNTILAFDAVVSSFSALDFGRTGYTNKVKVTTDNVIFYDESGNILSTTAHGLTIANTVSVRIVHSMEVNADQITVTVSSNGVIGTPVTKGWSNPRNGNPYVKSDGSSLTDCMCAFAMADINKRTWVFGDSYCSIANNRWMGQLSNAGYAKNIMLNAYSGESAAQNIPSLINMIDKGNVGAIVWANGMNDGSDPSGRPNTFWLNAVQVFIAACESRRIIPILTTVPTVSNNGTIINNEQKNAWVRNSGKRYIDFAKAVGANSSGVWYNGMLSNDEVHPTELGAIALFNRAVADCPELMEQ